jgi:hypothetical protein
MISWFALLSGQIFTPAAALGDGLLELDGEGLGDGDGIPGGMEPSGVGGRLELEPELDREPLEDAGCALRICVSNVVISSASANFNFINSIAMSELDSTSSAWMSSEASRMFSV